MGLAGLILATACAALLIAPKFRLPKRTSAPVGLAVGFIGGLMEGVSAIPGPLLATYLLATGATGKQFTKQIALVLIISIAALILSFGQSRHADGADLLFSACASIPVVIGILLGRPLRDALPPAAFRIVVLLFILVAAMQMVLRSHLVFIRPYGRKWPLFGRSGAKILVIWAWGRLKWHGLVQIDLLVYLPHALNRGVAMTSPQGQAF